MRNSSDAHETRLIEDLQRQVRQGADDSNVGMNLLADPVIYKLFIAGISRSEGRERNKRWLIVFQSGGHVIMDRVTRRLAATVGMDREIDNVV